MSLLLPILPEVALLILVLGLFVQTLLSGEAAERTGWSVAGAFVVLLASVFSLQAEVLYFYGSYQVDAVSQFFKLAVAVGLLIAAANGLPQPHLDKRKRADWFLFVALSAWGLMLLASSVELMTMVIALEISSFALYALVPLRVGRPEAAEAGAKYILFGAVTTGLTLFGLAYLLAGTGTSYLAGMAGTGFTLAASPLAAVGLTLFFAAFLYKLALFPLHFWAPDVYDGAGNETAAVVATLPKLGAVVVLVRLVSLMAPGAEIGLILAVLGAASMTLGNLMALAQRDVKRILGYSSVAHAGYVTLGLVAGTAEGLAAAAFYALVYLIMNLAAFWVVCRLSGDGRNVRLDDLAGLHAHCPLLALTLAVAAFSLVGLPPTAGFTGKLFLLTAAWGHGYNWLVIVAALNTAISIFYYLNLVRYAYTVEGGIEFPVSSMPRAAAGIGGAALAVFLLLLGVLPGAMFGLAEAAGKILLP